MVKYLLVNEYLDPLFPLFLVSGSLQGVSTASDLDEFVVDKRERWRANSSKANQRQRRYKKRLTKQIILLDKNSFD